MSPKLQAAVQSLFISLGGVAAALGYISASDQATIANVGATVIGVVFSVVGAVWNHTSAPAATSNPTSQAPK